MASFMQQPRIYTRDNPIRAIQYMARQPIEAPTGQKVVQIGKTIGQIKGPKVPSLPALPSLKVHPNWFKPSKSM